MSHIDVFKRYEYKYMLDADSKAELLEVLDGHMKLDEYGRTTIRNVYYDTPDYALIRKSLEKPVYKEKLRVRSYSKVTEDDNVYVEIKKKYMGIVYKRRTAVREHQAEGWLDGTYPQPYISQIADEIEYFRRLYKGLKPSCFLSYERESYYSTDGSGLRLTMDEKILGRTCDMSLTEGVYGDRIIPPGCTLLELKTAGAIPLYLTKFLSDNDIARTSFSKYGSYYENKIRKASRATYRSLLHVQDEDEQVFSRDTGFASRSCMRRHHDGQRQHRRRSRRGRHLQSGSLQIRSRHRSRDNRRIPGDGNRPYLRYGIFRIRRHLHGNNLRRHDAS